MAQENNLLPADVKYKSEKRNGLYFNPFKTWSGLPSFCNFFAWQIRSGFKLATIPNQQELDAEENLPIRKLDFDVINNPKVDNIYCTWIGHATVLVQMDGINLLTDPIFSQRCSPSQYFGPQRFRNTPCSISDLPNIDAVVISHNHYDHLDFNTVKELEKKFSCSWFVPAGMKQWMIDTGCKNVEELEWWEKKELKGVEFVFTPAQHWSTRTSFDRFKTLWGSWSIIGPKHKFFFAGDTGFCDAFKQIGKEFGKFDLAAIPIGAYCPNELMTSQHVDPKEAVQIHKDINADFSVGIHWGTFLLSSEPYLEPREKIHSMVKDEKDSSGHDLNFVTLNHGETLFIEKGKLSKFYSNKSKDSDGKSKESDSKSKDNDEMAKKK